MKYISFMNDAILQAEKAFLEGEVPVGCVIVKDNEIISKAHNLCEKNHNATHHAEILAINKAIERIGEKYLTDCSLYVTLEPCPMCAGAIINSRIKRVYIGCLDKNAGCAESVYKLLKDGVFNHTPEVYIGIEEEKCSKILKSFFKGKR